MRDHPRPPTADDPCRQCEILLGAEAERDRYQLLLDINNAVVTRPDLGSILHAPPILFAK